MRPHRKRSSTKRHHSRRAFLARLMQLLVVLGVLCLLLGGVLVVLAQFGPTSAREKQQWLGLGYLGAGLFLLLLTWLVDRIRRFVKTHPRRHPSPRTGVAPGDSRSGAVLVLTLVVLALLTGLLVQVQLRARGELRTAEAAVLHHRLQHAATDATRSALALLAEDDNLLFDATNEPWASPVEVRDPTGIETAVRITDENRYFDVNNLVFAPAEGTPRSAADIVMDVMTLCGDFSPVARVEALTDWVDADASGFRESRFYQEKRPPYRTPNRVLYAWRELLWVEGFNREFFRPRSGLRPKKLFQEDLVNCLTVLPFPRSRAVPVNLNTANRAVLMGLFGLGRDDIVDGILAMRAIRPLVSLGPVSSLAEPPLMKSIGAYLAVHSTVFRVEARAYADQGAVDLHALVRRGPEGDLQVLQWVW
jgi:type II secretory pathway component PulK